MEELEKEMSAYSNIDTKLVKEDLRYLQLLSGNFPTIASASTEIINLEAILNLPKFPCRPTRRE